MDLELKLWDDTRGQVIQFYLAKLFRRGNSNKTKLLYHFRICKIDPEDSNLVPMLEIINRESMLTDWESFLNSLRELLYARIDNACFSPREKDIALGFNRILSTPQISTEISIDGTAYLMQSPGITEHMSVAFKFMTTNDLLKGFSAKLYQILQNREFRTNIEQLPQQEFKNAFDVVEDEQADEEDDTTSDVEENIESDLVVKDTKTSTEMLEKRDNYTNRDKKPAAADDVTMEDWDEDEVDEIGGSDNDNQPNNSSKAKESAKIAVDATPAETKIDKAPEREDEPELESIQKTPEEKIEPEIVETTEISVKSDDKQDVKTEKPEKELKTGQKTPKPKKSAAAKKEPEKSANNETTEKPKRKRRTPVKKVDEGKSLLDAPKPKRKPGRKPAIKKPTAEKNDKEKS